MKSWSWARKSANALAPYIPLQQTLAWIFLIAVIVFLFRKQIAALIQAINSRIEAGSGVEAGPFKLSPELMKMDNVAEKQATSPKAEPSLEQERDGIYKQHRGIFLAHILNPSHTTGQEFDIFIFWCDTSRLAFLT